MLKNPILDTLCQQYHLNALQLEQLEYFVARVISYNQRYNLIATSTINDIWFRHILDSIQLLPHIQPLTVKLLDLGSGAGFPGIVLAIAGVKSVTLIEKSFRKAEFLQQIATELKLSVTIYQQTVAQVIQQHPEKFDYITSRAFAPLPDLIRYSTFFLSPTGFCLFLKGKKYAEEIQAAQHLLQKFTVHLVNSCTSPESRLIILH